MVKRWSTVDPVTPRLHQHDRLAVVLFFGFTGLTLNHRDWTFGIEPTISIQSGELPQGSIEVDGTVEFLTISEFFRNEMNVSGEITDFGTAGTEGFISYRGPGYSADAFFDTATTEFDLNTEAQGWVGVMNDLHKGRDSGATWSWVIDVSAGFLVLISLTGLGLQLFLRKRRRSAIITALVGLAVAAVFTWIAIT